MSNFGLADSWWLQHPDSKDYSFFSPVQHSYSRIDFFLTSNSIIPNISDSTIHPIVISNHAPVTIKWDTTSPLKPPIWWRFNTSLLQDINFDSFTERVRMLSRNEWFPWNISTPSVGNRKGSIMRKNNLIFSIQKEKRKRTWNGSGT